MNEVNKSFSRQESTKAKTKTKTLIRKRKTGQDKDTTILKIMKGEDGRERQGRKKT